MDGCLEIDLEMFRGNTRQFLLIFTNVDGTPTDLTGCKVWMTAKYYISDLDGAAVFQLTSDVGDGIVIPTPKNGQAFATVLPAATVMFPANEVTLVYDVQLKDGSTPPVVTTTQAGKLRVYPTATQTQS